MALGHWLKDYIGPHSGGSGGGSGGGTEPLIVNFQEDGTTLDRTWQEIHDAFPNVLIKNTLTLPIGEQEKLFSVCVVEQVPIPNEPTDYLVRVYDSSTTTFYSTDSPSGFPVLSQE